MNHTIELQINSTTKHTNVIPLLVYTKVFSVSNNSMFIKKERKCYEFAPFITLVWSVPYVIYLVHVIGVSLTQGFNNFRSTS